MDRFDPFVKYADVYGDIINWEKDPMNKPQNQNKYFFSDGKTYYEQICKMLRLMSVFKEAFNQIYSNEDEISEAWENFVNNLSASVVEGSEPDVTLTWTDDSVNFEFTMVPGVPGEQGVGITSISFNSDYTMTITLSDGNSYTSMSLKGETGPQGPQGETGSGLQILDVYATLADLQSAHPTGQPGDAYQVGSAGNYTLYIWSSSQSAWVPAGSLGTVSPSLSNPLMDGTASAGSLNQYSRGDHVHPSDTSRASKEELDALIKTSQALIDQSFTYRESPAIQDGLARIDKIKGNTLRWNQIFIPQNRNVNEIRANVIQDGNDYSVRIYGTSTANAWLRMDVTGTLPVGHKFLLDKGSTSDLFDINNDNNGLNVDFSAKSKIGTVTTADKYIYIYVKWGTTIDVTVKPILIDLTAMFGAGNEPTTVEEFTSFFPLQYYEYNAGSLLSFNGNGLKTVGKNLFDLSQFASGPITFIDDVLTGTGAQFHSAYGTYATAKKLNNPRGSQITISFDAWTDQNVTSSGNGLIVSTYHYDGTHEDATISNATGTPTHFRFQRQDIEKIGLSYGTQGANRWHITNFQVEFGTAETSYEPYTESTLSLPISTYFPTGMKSAMNAYDELTPSKARTIVGSYTITSFESKSGATANNLFLTNAIMNLVKKPSADTVLANVKSNYGEAKTMSVLYNNDTVGVAINTNGTIYVGFGLNGSVTTLEQANAYVQSNPITVYYELATPVETSISPELDLSFMAYENGTEQLLPVNGSVPATSPVIADMTYMSIDDAMEYILDKLANVPQNTQQILESLEDDVADLQTDVGALQPAVSALQTSVGNINTNIGQISSTVAGHTSSISDMQSDISDLNTGLNNLNTGLNDLEDTVTDNTSRIRTLETGLTNTDSQVDAIDARVLNLETDLLIVVKKEYDYDSVAGNTNFGVQTGLSQEPGYKIIGIVGSEVQQGEYTSAEPWIIVTQAHVRYTSTGGVVLSMMARNVSEYTKTNVRVYLYLLCIKDTQSE